MLVEAPQRYGVTIVGLVAADTGWQVRVEGGLNKAAFQVDLEQEVVTCPAGKRSISWLPNTWPENGMMFEARFARWDCTPLCLASFVPPRQARAAHHRPAGPRALRGAIGCTSASENGGVSSKLRRAPVSRARTPRPSATVACAGAATLVGPRHTCST